MKGTEKFSTHKKEGASDLLQLEGMLDVALKRLWKEIPERNKPSWQDALPFAGIPDAIGYKIFKETWGRIKRAQSSFERKGKMRPLPPREKKLARALELSLAVGGLRHEDGRQDMQWFGECADAFLSHNAQDYFGKTDLTVVLTTPVEVQNKSLLHTMRLDASSGEISMFKKVWRSLHALSDGADMETLPFTNLHLGPTAQVQGATLVGSPTFVVSLSRKTTQHIAGLFSQKKWSKLKYHPVQLLILEQIQAQAGAYIRFLEARRDEILAHCAMKLEEARDVDAQVGRKDEFSSEELEALWISHKKQAYYRNTPKRLSQTINGLKDMHEVIAHVYEERKQILERNHQESIGAGYREEGSIMARHQDHLHEQIMVLMNDDELLHRLWNIPKEEF